MYTLTRVHNDYDQHGDYLEAVWLGKPTMEEISRVLNCDHDLARHIYNGGGRIDYEDIWYYLSELKNGELYKHSQ